MSWISRHRLEDHTRDLDWTAIEVLAVELLNREQHLRFRHHA